VGAIKELGQRSVKERWEDVSTLWEEAEDTREPIRRMVKETLETAMVVELERVLAAGQYERTALRQGFRKGFRQRQLGTGIGVIRDLRVPRAAGVHYKPGALDAFRRRDRLVEEGIRELFFQGISTRNVGKVLKLLTGESVSAGTVSRLTKQLDDEVRAFHLRPLEERHRYLFLDGVVVSSRQGASHGKLVLLCATAITHGGKRVFLDFRKARSESEAEWRVLLNSLYNRGVRPEHLELVTTDGGTGLHAALLEVYGDVPRQRCWAHKLRNVAANLRRANQEACLKQAKLIYSARTRSEAVKRFWEWAQAWRSLEPKAVACLEKDLEELLSVFAVPAAHRQRVRTTNVIERFFRDVRRRTRPMGCFQNANSAERVLFFLAARYNEKWEDRPLLAFKSPHSI
jgi:putative transposase